MAEMNINIATGIHAEIAEGNFSMLSNSSVTLDPLTKSYSDNGELVYYNLSVVYSEGLNNIKLLNNGKNSRLSCAGNGYLQVELYIRDSTEASATDLITITVN